MTGGGSSGIPAPTNPTPDRRPMPPHVASPSRLLRAELAAQVRALAKRELAVDCGGSVHHLRFDRSRLYPADHDEAGEAALRALGGVEPACVRVVDAVDGATSADWWATLDPRGGADASGIGTALLVLPRAVRRVLGAGALAEEFGDAAPAVRDRVAQLGLALLGDGPLALDALRTRFQLTREFPRWDPGAGPWSDKELVLLARCMRAASGEARPHLVLLPSDPLARRAVAKYVVTLLDHERFLTVGDLRSSLTSTHRNVKALTTLLVAEGLLVEHAGQYRVRAPTTRNRPRNA